LSFSKNLLKPYPEQIIGFSGERVEVKRHIELKTRLVGKPSSRVTKICYLVVDADTSYNALLGRPSLNTLGAIVSTPHLAMKFPAESKDIFTVYGDQKIARECYIASLKVYPLRVSRHNKYRASSGNSYADLAYPMPL